MIKKICLVFQLLMNKNSKICCIASNSLLPHLRPKLLIILIMKQKINGLNNEIPHDIDVAIINSICVFSKIAQKHIA